MTITQADFIRLLPKAIKPYTYQQKNSAIHITVLNSQQQPAGQIIITLGKQQTRTIGSLKLPVMQITFHIVEMIQQTQQTFFKQFDNAYHRGGG